MDSGEENSGDEPGEDDDEEVVGDPMASILNSKASLQSRQPNLERMMQIAEDRGTYARQWTEFMLRTRSRNDSNARINCNMICSSAAAMADDPEKTESDSSGNVRSERIDLTSISSTEDFTMATNVAQSRGSLPGTEIARDRSLARQKSAMDLNPQESSTNRRGESGYVGSNDSSSDETAGSILRSSTKKQKLVCAFPGCTRKHMPLTPYCHPHILSDPRQKLYKPCEYIIKRGKLPPITCKSPILAAPDLHYCTAHALLGLQQEFDIRNIVADMMREREAKEEQEKEKRKHDQPKSSGSKH
ncbi:uncharacterized protein LOC144710903 [Wolffia australiana]